MNPRERLAKGAEEFLSRRGIAYEKLLGIRFAINVFVAGGIVWFTLRAIADTNPIWAIASMVAASDPEPLEARRMFTSRLINVAVGCVSGLAILAVGGSSDWLVPVALAGTVLVSSYLVRVKTMWRQGPITAAVVIAGGIAAGSTRSGMEQGLHKVAEVIFGCVVGMLVSWAMSRVWLVRPPAAPAGSD